jgi:hypothetical protein
MVQGALHSLGQMFAPLGYSEPHLQSSGNLGFQLQCQLQQYNKVYPPPTHVKPVPLQVLQLAINQCYRSTSPMAHAIAQMLLLGFFFLLHPGEYAHTMNEDAAPFHICDVHLITHNR